ncbi:YvrJ family protein [Clostridium chromiireducens]|uniref:YvrJ family protein n=1 Tax=Clostridium chromiireducens TaxID=225345 RepID=A0A399IU22_9CLOT|nr:YvrJ family protein [Clostridium chromiireducens]MVX65647.1 YvrJ family protein [Clostridium chromiireducens]RII35032.1 YvrJ family protein [Clostridium chromiireducens]
MGINDMMSLITNAGFPIAVCAYLLFRLEKQLSSLSSSIQKLNTIISTKLGVVIDTTSDKINNL